MYFLTCSSLQTWEETQAQRGDVIVQDLTASESGLKPGAVEFQSLGS